MIYHKMEGFSMIYVMSDIHGCYDELLQMLKQIEFSNNDRLIVAGDYIDRGNQSYEMLKWIESASENIILLRGNHDEEFAYCIDLMGVMFEQKQLPTDNFEATEVVYDLLNELAENELTIGAFDYYGTIKKLIKIKCSAFSKSRNIASNASSPIEK